MYDRKTVQERAAEQVDRIQAQNNRQKERLNLMVQFLTDRGLIHEFNEWEANRK